MSNGIGPQNEIPAGRFDESSRAGNQSKIEPNALSHFFRLRSGSRELQEITPCLRGGRAVLYAARYGHVEVINMLLQNGTISVEARGRAVMSAAQNGHAEIIERLLRNGAQISDEARGRAVMSAAQNGHTEIIERLLRNGAQISDEARGIAVDSAASEGRLEVIAWLIQLWPGYRGQAVCGAAEKGHIDIIERLLEGGARISEVYGEIAVRSAAENGHVEVIERLLRYGAEINTYDRCRAVRCVAQNGRLEVVRLIQLWPEYRDIALDSAASEGHIDIIERLLEGGAEISGFNRYQAVRCAAVNGRLEVVERLLEYWPEHRGVAVDGAASEGHIEVVERLLEGGAQIDEVYRYQAVVNAATNGHLDVVERLLRDGAEISEHHLAEALRSATRNGHRDVVDRLLESGAQIRYDYVNRPLNDRDENFPLELADDAVGINDPNEYLYVPTWEDLQNHPLGYLRSFVELGPSRIRFGDGTAVDTGGVTKEFVNRLVESLKEQKLICCDEDFGEWVSLPIAKTEEQKEALFLFGQLLTHLSRKNADRSDKIMIPKILDPRLFAVMLAGEGNELQTLECVDSIRDIWEKDLPNSQSIQDLKGALSSQEEDGPFLTKFKEWKASVQEGIRLLKEGIDSPLTDAMGTPEGCGRLQEEFFGKEITSRSVMENLKICRPQEFELSYGKMVRWLKDWIDEADDEKLIQFVFCTTGHKSLNMGKIHIEQNMRGAVMSAAIEIHTCSNSLALPRVENIDQESFIQALEASLEQKSYNVG